MTEGTCRWIMDQKQYLDWIDPGSQDIERGAKTTPFWIIGNPGSGKTYIAQVGEPRSSVQHVLAITNSYQWLCLHLQNKSSQEHQEKGRSYNVMYFFFDSKDDHSGSLKKFYPTILRQLLEGLNETTPQNKAECFKQAQRRLREGVDKVESYIEALRDVLSHGVHSFLIIDALDECTDGNTPGALEDWLQTITSLPNLSIAITCRSVTRTRELYQVPNCNELQLSNVVDELDQDLDKYITQRVHSKPKSYPAEMERVMDRLKQKSSVRIISFSSLRIPITPKLTST